MADTLDIATLTSMRDEAIAALRVAQVKPSYKEGSGNGSLEVQWSEHVKTLRETIAWTTEQLERLQGPTMEETFIV